MKKGQKVSNETRRRMSIAKKGCIPWNAGKAGVQTHSEETKMRIRINNLGKHAKEKSGNWKGDAVGYMALHTRIRTELGRPTLCTECGKLGKLEMNGKVWNIQYANISGKYYVDASDFKALCRSCHMKLDYSQHNRTRRIKK